MANKKKSESSVAGIFSSYRNEPTYWLVVLKIARDRGDFDRADQAKSELKRLDVSVPLDWLADSYEPGPEDRGPTMKIKEAVRTLTKRREWLSVKLEEHPNYDFHKAEIGSIDLAIKCMKLVRSYGFVAVTEFGPLLEHQQYDPKEKYGKP